MKERGWVRGPPKGGPLRVAAAPEGVAVVGAAEAPRSPDALTCALHRAAVEESDRKGRTVTAMGEEAEGI